MGIHERIFLTEDHEGLRAIAARCLKQAGHEVVFQAGDFETAMEGTKHAEKLGITAAVLDGNLTEGDYECRDGQKVAAALRSQIPNIPIVAYTSEQERASYGDVFVDKSNMNSVEQLTNVVTALEHPVQL